MVPAGMQKPHEEDLVTTVVAHDECFETPSSALHTRPANIFPSMTIQHLFLETRHIMELIPAADFKPVACLARLLHGWQCHAAEIYLEIRLVFVHLLRLGYVQIGLLGTLV